MPKTAMLASLALTATLEEGYFENTITLTLPIKDTST